MIAVEKISIPHWNYFLALEEDLDRLSRFVEFSKPNLETYSIEIVRILLAASSETEVIAKQLCELVEPSARACRIDQYRELLMRHFPVIARAKINVPRYALTLSPWENWESDRSPDWWRAYNLVKHSRHENYASAQLQHALHAVAALLILALFLYQREAKQGALYPNPRLLSLGAPFEPQAIYWGHDGRLSYDLARFV